MPSKKTVRGRQGEASRLREYACSCGLYSQFIFSVLQTRSFTRPFRHLPPGIGDYSHLNRFETKADSFIRQMSGWKEGDPEPLDLGLVMKESFKFSSDTDRAFAALPPKFKWQVEPIVKSGDALISLEVACHEPTVVRSHIGSLHYRLNVNRLVRFGHAYCCQPTAASDDSSDDLC